MKAAANTTKEATMSNTNQFVSVHMSSRRWAREDFLFWQVLLVTEGSPYAEVLKLAPNERFALAIARRKAAALGLEVRP